MRFGGRPSSDGGLQTCAARYSSIRRFAAAIRLSNFRENAVSGGGSNCFSSFSIRLMRLLIPRRVGFWGSGIRLRDLGDLGCRE